jgi:hypothetical protein
LAVVVEVPFLDGFFLESLYDERPIWDDPTLQRRCIAFAESVLERADAVTDMMWGAADEA